MLISIGLYVFNVVCVSLDWQYAELPSSASDAVLCSVFFRKMLGHLKQIEKKKKKKNTSAFTKSN